MRSAQQIAALLSFTVVRALAKTVSITPHDKYSSSVGVLGCKVNTNRIAYWPSSISCDSICIELSHSGRTVNLLLIDQSQGAFDVSYDAWNYLKSGRSAREDPQTGGGLDVEYRNVPAEDCADLIKTDSGGLPLSASNSINYLSSCLHEPSSWVAKNHVLYNILDSICTWGYDEECQLDLATSNQPRCKHTLGLTTALTTCPVYDIEYSTGNVILAGNGKPADPDTSTASANRSVSPTSATRIAAASSIITAVSMTLTTRLVAEHTLSPSHKPASDSDSSLLADAPATASAPARSTPSSKSSSPDDTNQGGKFIEDSGPITDAALAVWANVFVRPLLEKWNAR